MHIALTYDLRDDYRKLGFSEEATAEFDSIETIDAIAEALTQMGHRVERIGNIWKLTEALADGKRWDLVFNICEGLHGIAREAQVPALLEAYNQPYVFSPPEVLVVAHDKALAKLCIAQAGLATAAWHLVREEAEIEQVLLPFPLFAKPVAEGTSKGVSEHSLVHNPKELRTTCSDLLQRFQQPVLVETYLPGREFTVGIVGNGTQAQAIGAIEVDQPQGGETVARTYANKGVYETTADCKLVHDKTAQSAIELALAAWATLGCRDAGRVDIRCDAQNKPHFIEVNPLAGMKPNHSDLPVMAALAGIDYTTLVGRMLAAALERTQLSDLKQNQSCAC